SVVSLGDLIELVSFPALISGDLLTGALSVVSLADLTPLVSFPAFTSADLFNGDLPVAVDLAGIFFLKSRIDSFETGRSFGFHKKPFNILSSSVNLSSGP